MSPTAIVSIAFVAGFVAISAASWDIARGFKAEMERRRLQHTKQVAGQLVDIAKPQVADLIEREVAEAVAAERERIAEILETEADSVMRVAEVESRSGNDHASVVYLNCVQSLQRVARMVREGRGDV